MVEKNRANVVNHDTNTVVWVAEGHGKAVETVWLTRNQMADLFERDVKTIGKHINNALKEELDF